MAHPPLQPRRRLREVGPGGEAPDPGGGKAELKDPPGRIELRLRLLAQLFHSFDPSPFRERELDATAEEFIVGWAWDLPRRIPLELVIHLEEARHESPAELNALVGDAIRNHFRYRAETKRRQYRALMARGRTSLSVGLAFYALCFVVGQALVRVTDSPVAELAQESLLIGGWVAMWRPIEIFLYDSWVVRRAQSDLARLARIQVRVLLPK
jgi:hypothetical protein